MNPLVYTDSYKLSHKGFMDAGTEKIYSNLTARSFKHMPVLKDRFDDKIVFFGLQHFIWDYLIKEWNTNFFCQAKRDVIPKTKRLFDAYLGEGAVPMEHFEALHDLGYLPIHIKALPEGSRVNKGVPLLTITNTHQDFAWLTNYLETVMSCELWKPCTTATIIYEYRKLAIDNAIETTGSDAGTEFQIHGFDFRGMSGRHDAAINAAAFLLSSCGTDTIPALEIIENSYFTDITENFIATSVPASEHSIACLGTSVEGELESYRRWITESYPKGIVSLVSDTYDYWRVLTEYLPALKDDIMNRPVNALGLSKVVIRPDSGDPYKIICGTVDKVFSNMKDATDYYEVYHKDKASDDCEGAYNCGMDEYTDVCMVDGVYYEVTTKFDYNRHDKTYYYIDNYRKDAGVPQFQEIVATPEMKGSVQLLWETFGGTVTHQGYKVLDSHIGLIYGDSITLELAERIFGGLKALGFATTNVILGVGSYTMQYLTRDSAGMAIKATYAEVDGNSYELYKDPITDDGTKKSAKGLLRVEKEGDNYVLYDQQTLAQEATGELTTVFLDGTFTLEHTFPEIRERLWAK